MTHPKPDLAALKAIAEAATPGKWEAVPDALKANSYTVQADGLFVVYSVRAPPKCGRKGDYYECQPLSADVWTRIQPNNAAHIAAFDPPTVLALIELAGKAEAAIAERDNLSIKFDQLWEQTSEVISHVDPLLRAERDALKADRDALQAELAAIKQAITDPENQPSQYGTVTLAWHEAEMAGARARVGELAEALRQIDRTAEMSAAIMRDNQRTSGWEGSERVARAFERLSEKARDARFPQPKKGE